MKGYYSVQELADQLGVTTRSIRNYLHEGKLKGTKVGGKWKFSEQNLFDFLYGDKENLMIQKDYQVTLDVPVTLKLSLVTDDFHEMDAFKEQLFNYHSEVYANKNDRLIQYTHFKENEYDILIGGNFNYVTNFGSWIYEQLLKQTSISLKKN